jgi:hypothetical protein
MAARMARRTRTSSSGFFRSLMPTMVLALGAADQHIEARIGLELRHAARHCGARKHVDVARQQCRDLR